MKIITFILVIYTALMLSTNAARRQLVNLKLGRAKKNFSETDRGSRVSWCRLKFPVSSRSRGETDWHSHPSGDVKFTEALRHYTSINIKQEWNVADIQDLDKMCAFPVLFIHGQCPISIGSKSENNLKEYVLRGGFLLIDDCKYKNHPIADQFFLSMKRKLIKILPGIKFKQLKPGHKVYRCNFSLAKWPHMQGKNNGVLAAYYRKRLIAFLYSSDLHCGWVDVGWFPYSSTLNAYRMGINLYVYAMNN